VWTYNKTFIADPKAGTNIIVFDGIKMSATISVNGQVIGQAADQFVRYEFVIPAALIKPVPSSNTLTVQFDPTVPVGGRFAAFTGGWDW
jgi:beta-mannosidase